MKDAQRVALNTTLQFAARLFLTAIGLVVFALVARQLGVGGFGSYALVMAVVPLFASLADLGVTTISVRQLAQHPEEREQIAGTVFTVKAGLALAACIALLVLIPLLPYDRELRIALVLALAGLLLHLLAMIPGVVFQATLRLDLQVVVDLTTGIVSLALVLVVIVSGGGLHALVLAWVASVGVGCALAYALVLRLVRIRPRLDRPLASLLVRRALPLGLVLVLSTIHFRVDSVLLSLLRPIEDVGIYNAAFRFLEHVLLAPTLFMAALFPLLAAYAGRDDPRLPATVSKAFTFLLLLGMPVAVGAFLLAQPLIEFIVGAEFEAAVTPLRILVFVVVVAFVNSLFAHVLIAYDLQFRILLVSVAAVVLNLALNLALIPRYAYNGAAAATVVSGSAGAVVIAWWATRRSRVAIDVSAALRVGVASLAMAGAVVAAAGAPFGVRIGLGAAVYVALVFALRIVGRRDLDVLIRGAD